jgi:hypothetical protein
MDGQESSIAGVTSEELTRVAAELGIQPKYVQQALSEAPNYQSGKRRFRLTQEFNRIVDVELQPDDYDEFLNILHPANNRFPLQQFGRTVSGTSLVASSVATFEVTSKKGQTSIKIVSNQTAVFVAMIALAFLVSVMMILFSAMLPGGTGVAAFVVSISAFLLAALTCLAIVPAIHRSAERLTNQVAECIASAADLDEVEGGNRTSAEIGTLLADQHRQDVEAT